MHLKAGDKLICHKNESENFNCCQPVQRQSMVLTQKFHSGIMDSLEIYMALFPADTENILDKTEHSTSPGGD